MWSANLKVFEVFATWETWETWETSENWETWGTLATSVTSVTSVTSGTSETWDTSESWKTWEACRRKSPHQLCCCVAQPVSSSHVTLEFKRFWSAWRSCKFATPRYSKNYINSFQVHLTILKQRSKYDSKLVPEGSPEASGEETVLEVEKGANETGVN